MLNTIADFFQNLFSPIVSVLGAVLLYFHQTVGAPWSLSIVLLTVIVRSLLFPLTVKHVRSMRAMQDLKPHMDRVRSQFKDNPQRQREEMAKLYQEQGVNPLGGCLPILVQMPIFIGIFYVIRQFGGTPGRTPPEYPSFTDGGILWFQDLAHADPYYLLPIISAVTMLAATEITSNVMTLIQNYAIYNYGPGKKSPDSSKTTDNKNAKGVAGDRHAQNSNQEQSSDKSQEEIAKQAAKAAKRKRRKKKK